MCVNRKSTCRHALHIGIEYGCCVCVFYVCHEQLCVHRRRRRCVRKYIYTHTRVQNYSKPHNSQSTYVENVRQRASGLLLAYYVRQCVVVGSCGFFDGETGSTRVDSAGSEFVCMHTRTERLSRAAHVT